MGIVVAVVALYLSRSVPVLLKTLQAVLAAMTNNPRFPNAGPLLASLSANLATLDADEKATATRAAGTVATREATRLLVVSDAKALKALVQKVCDASPAEAEAIAQSAAMTLGKARSRTKPPLAAKRGLVAGLYNLIARAIRGAGSYEWQMSLDGKTWINLPGTKVTRTSVANLTVGATYFFRVRAITSKGATDWIQVDNIVIT